jgi:aryl carrier-like protein
MLRLERVGVHDNFFDLGGHSLLVVRVHDRLRQAGYSHLTVADMFKYPTISALSQYLSIGNELETQVSLNHAQERARRQQEALRRHAAVKTADRKVE